MAPPTSEPFSVQQVLSCLLLLGLAPSPPQSSLPHTQMCSAALLSKLVLIFLLATVSFSILKKKSLCVYALFYSFTILQIFLKNHVSGVNRDACLDSTYHV